MAGHHELLAGEVFIGNFDASQFKDIGLRGKRRGTQAYDVNGRPYNGAFPVFVPIAVWNENIDSAIERHKDVQDFAESFKNMKV